jgi:hypothetical protein
MIVQLPPGGGGADAAVAAATAASKNYSPGCGSWTAGISQAGLEEGSPIMQLLKELARLWQLDSCYQPGCN